MEASARFVSTSRDTSKLVGNTAIEESSAFEHYSSLELKDRSATGGKQPTSHNALNVV